VFPALRFGRQYLRPVSFLDKPFDIYSGGEIIAWSRILNDEEIVIVFNPHGSQIRGADILVDASLNPDGGSMTIVANTEEAGIDDYTEANKTGSLKRIQKNVAGIHYIEIRSVGPSELIVLVNKG
jgi:hypothetical protein